MAGSALAAAGELIDVEALLLAFDEVGTAFDKPKVRRRSHDITADQYNRFGIGTDGLAEALQPLRRIHRIAHDGVVDPVRRADVADHDRPHMDSDTDADRRQSISGAPFIVSC